MVMRDLTANLEDPFPFNIFDLILIPLVYIRKKIKEK